MSPDLGSAILRPRQHGARSTMSNQTRPTRTQPTQPNTARCGGIAGVCSPNWWAPSRAHNCPTVIDVALIQPCDVVSFGSGPQCAWTPDDIPGFLIAFHARAPQIPRSDLPHGGRSRPDTTLLRMNHCQPPGKDVTFTLSATPCCGLRDKEASSKEGPSAQPTRGGLPCLDPTARGSALLKCWNYLRSWLAPRSSRPMEERGIIGR